MFRKAALYRPVMRILRSPKEHRGDLAPVFEEILGQQRDNLVPHDLVHIRSGVAASEIGMTDLVVTVIEVLDPFIDDRQEGRQIDPRAGRSLLQNGRIGHDFAECEPPPQRRIEQSRAMERSAVFIVPTICRFDGTPNSSPE